MFLQVKIGADNRLLLIPLAHIRFIMDIETAADAGIDGLETVDRKWARALVQAVGVGGSTNNFWINEDVETIARKIGAVT